MRLQTQLKKMRAIGCVLAGSSVIMMLGGCGVSSNTGSNVTVTAKRVDTTEALAMLRSSGYRTPPPPPSFTGKPAASGLAFPIDPQYGRPIGAVVKRGLAIIVLRGNAHTPRPVNPTIFWYKAGDVILLGVPPPRKKAEYSAQFEAAIGAIR
jgi:hypothetical protein